jgi:hypothetical protein
MSSIPYSFHCIQRSRDIKKQRQLELNESTPTTSTASLNQPKNGSVSPFIRFLKPQTNSNEREYVRSYNQDFEILHSIV